MYLYLCILVTYTLVPNFLLYRLSVLSCIGHICALVWVSSLLLYISFILYLVAGIFVFSCLYLVYILYFVSCIVDICMSGFISRIIILLCLVSGTWYSCRFVSCILSYCVSCFSYLCILYIYIFRSFYPPHLCICICVSLSLIYLGICHLCCILYHSTLELLFICAFVRLSSILYIYLHLCILSGIFVSVVSLIYILLSCIPYRVSFICLLCLYFFIFSLRYIPR